MRPLVFASVVKGALYHRHMIVLLRSWTMRNKACHRPWIIIHDKTMGENQKQALRNEYPLVEFWKAPVTDYKPRLREKDKTILTPQKFPGLMSFEIANPKAMDAKKVVFLDADMVCDNAADEIIAYDGEVCMMKEPRYDQFSAAVIVCKPSEKLYQFLMSAEHKLSVNEGWGTDQNIWNQVKGIKEIKNPNQRVHRWSPKGYGGESRPALWHYIAKFEKSAKASPPGSGGWKNTNERPKKLFEVYDSYDPLYPHRPFRVFSTGRNCGHRAKRCIQSMIAQSDPNWQMIVIDDASTDGTADSIRELCKDPRISLIENKAQKFGPYNRYNAIMMFPDMQPDDICVQLDLDDELLPNALHRISLEYRHQPNVWMTYGNLKDQNGKRYEPKPPSVLETWDTRERMICLAPRTFRAGLFWLVGEDEFKYGGEWQPCKFDVAATSAMQEMAGPERMRRIRTVIYRAQVDTERNVVGTFGHEREREFRRRALSKPRRERIEKYATVPPAPRPCNEVRFAAQSSLNPSKTLHEDGGNEGERSKLDAPI